MYARSIVEIRITDRQNVDKMTENVDIIWNTPQRLSDSQNV
jgi:hypothetical protein